MAVLAKTKVKPRLAVWKLASCDGCQLTLLDCEDELLAVAGAVEIAHFIEASSSVVEGPYDVSLVEGSVTTERDARRIAEIRAASKFLVCIGACATSGGIQALRNFADVAEFTSVVYAHPEYICSLATSTPVSDHVPVDFELRGCPIDKRQLLELLTALLAGRKPQIPAHSVCYDCKLRGTSCVMVAHGTPCLGPITPGRLRRHLPRLRPRLLRLLRPGGLAEPRRSGRTAAAARHDRGRRGPGAGHVQRRRSRPRLGPRESGALTHGCRAAQACMPSSVSSRANASSAAPRRGASEPSRAGMIGGGGIARKAISPS